MKIENVREWIEVTQVEHLVDVSLGDETNTENSDNYSITLNPCDARELADRLYEAAEAAEDVYDEQTEEESE